VGLINCESNNAAELSAQEKTVSKSSEVDENAVLVETVSLQPRIMRSYILLSSTVESEQMVDVYPRVTGIVTELNVEEGDIIDENSILVQLEDNQQKLAEQKAKVDYNRKKTDLERVTKSYEKKIISEVDYETSKFALEEAKINWEQAKLDLSYTKVFSPIKGVVAERLVRKGDRVQPSTKLFHIVDTSDKIARVFIPEQDISSLKTGQKAILTSEFLSNKQFQGKIKRVSPVVDPNSGTFKVTIGISDTRNDLRPGMFVSVRIITAVRDNVIAVPKDAVVYDSGLPFVFVIKENRANKIPLIKGFSDEQFIEAVEGLDKGDEIIITGHSGLKDRSVVKVVSKRK
jgi:membrane fusion protein (multidrug efflux system)